MGKADLTIVRLEAALKRILSRKPTRISLNRKLSVKAVEEEADLGDGSAYYYADFVRKVKEEICKSGPTVIGKSDNEKLTKLKKQLERETRLKGKYKRQIDLQREQLSKMAAEHNRLTIEAEELKNKIRSMEAENIQFIDLPNRD